MFLLLLIVNIHVVGFVFVLLLEIVLLFVCFLAAELRERSYYFGFLIVVQLLDYFDDGVESDVGTILK